MRILGHRGIAWNHPENPFPENTVRSLRAAVAAGATGAEIDLVMTRDGVVVLRHDDVLATRSPWGGQPRTDCHGRISTRDYADLAACSALPHNSRQQPSPIDRLDEALAVKGIELWVLDIKDDAKLRGRQTLRAIARDLHRAGATDRSVMMLYKPKSIAFATSLGLRSCLKRHRRDGLSPDQIAQEVQDAGAWASCANADIVDTRLAAALARRGLKQITYLLGNRASSGWDRKIRRLVSLGTYAVITDQVARARWLRDR